MHTEVKRGRARYFFVARIYLDCRWVESTGFCTLLRSYVILLLMHILASTYYTCMHAMHIMHIHTNTIEYAYEFVSIVYYESITIRTS